MWRFPSPIPAGSRSAFQVRIKPADDAGVPLVGLEARFSLAGCTASGLRCELLPWNSIGGVTAVKLPPATFAAVPEPIPPQLQLVVAQRV